GVYFMPIYGDEVMPNAPVEALQLGQFNRDFDLMFGGARNEGSGFALQLFPHFRSAHLTRYSIRQNISNIMAMYQIEPNPEKGVELYTENLGPSSSQDALRYVALFL